MASKILITAFMTTSLIVFRVEAADHPNLKALRMIETGDSHRLCIGKHGERGPYQIRECVWKEHSNLNFKVYAQQLPTASVVAMNHLHKLSEEFYLNVGRIADDIDLYILWNCGPAWYARHQNRQALVGYNIKERAMRYANLVWLYKNKN